MKTQEQMFYDAENRSANLNSAVMDMLNDKVNPMTPEELLVLCDRRPDVYGKFRGMAERMISTNFQTEESEMNITQAQIATDCN